MALQVADIIDQARDFHPALSKTNVPDLLMLRELTRGVSDLYDQIYPRVPGFLATELDVDLTAPGFDWAAAVNDVPGGPAPGLDLATLLPNGWKDITQGEFWMTGGVRPVVGTFQPWEQRSLPSRKPAFTLRNDALYFLGCQADYNRYATFRLVYTPNPTDLTLTGTVPLPHDAREPLATRLAVFGLLRMVGNPAFKIVQTDIQPFAVRAGSERTEFLTAIFRITQRQKYVVRDVRADPGGPWPWP